MNPPTLDIDIAYYRYSTATVNGTLIMAAHYFIPFTCCPIPQYEQLPHEIPLPIGQVTPTLRTAFVLGVPTGLCSLVSLVCLVRLAYQNCICTPIFEGT